MRTLQVKGSRMICKVLRPLYKSQRVPLLDNRGRQVKDDLGRTIKENQEILLKTLHVPTEFQIDGITLHGKTLTKKGELAKSKCVIYDKYTGQFYTVAHSMEEISEAIDYMRSQPPVGFLGHYENLNK